MPTYTYAGGVVRLHLDKGIERVASVLKFDLRGVDVRVDGVRQDEPLMQAQCRK